MRQERRGVFETNSSSTHSICIVSGEDVKLEPEKRVYFGCEEYGWEFASYYDVWNKADYLYAAILCNYDKDEVKKITDKIRDMLAEEGIECSFEEPEYRFYEYNGECHFYCNNASIDHGYEAKEFADAVLSSKDRLMRYLFSEKSFIKTGNDNSDYGDVKIDVDYPHEEYEKWN